MLMILFVPWMIIFWENHQVPLELLEMLMCWTQQAEEEYQKVYKQLSQNLEEPTVPKFDSRTLGL